MWQSQQFAELATPQLGRPPCPRCKVEMWLMHIMPDDPRRDIRTFTCPVCEYSESIVVRFE